MVSLPNIFQEGGQRFSDSESVSDDHERRLSTCFCNECKYALSLPVQQINRSVLKKYEEKYAQIRNMQRLLHEEETTVGDVKKMTESLHDHRSSFQISRSYKETLQVYSFGFPLITQSKLIHPESDEFNWEHLKNKVLKRQTRCNILHKTPQYVLERKSLATKHIRKHLKRLPSLHIETLGLQKGHVVSKRVSLCQKMLSADPEVVVFDNFEVGGCYEKRCKITNVSNGKCRFTIPAFENTSQFRVVHSKTASPLPAGLSFWVTIQFICNSLANTEEDLVIKSKEGEDLIIVVKAESEPPCLIEINELSHNLDVAVNSLIDCGSHLVGDKSQTILTLKNLGSSSRFCFVNESDWVSREFRIDNSNTLLADPFTIQPMYFGLKKYEEITICVTATPPSKGVHTTCTMLLCENGAINSVDLVCDGWLFEPNFIEHLGMLKTFDVDKEDVDFAECYLDFGPTLTLDINITSLFIMNTADVSLSYHWELRKVSIPGTNQVPPEALRIAPTQGRLAPNVPEMFYLQLDTHCVLPGVYRTLLVLVIDGLPGKCVPLEYLDRLLLTEEGNDNEFKSIEAKYIEVWAECVSPSISLCPYVIDFSDFPITAGETTERTITIRNDSPGGLCLEWICIEECLPINLNINPPKIRCEMYSTYNVTLTIEAVQEGPFNVSFWCVTKRGDAKVELQIKGECCKPQLTALTDSIDFGIVKLGSHVDTAIVAKNSSSSDSFSWTLDELYFRSRDEGLVAIPDDSTTLSTHYGKICHRNSEILVKYQLHCQNDTLWCSVLDWDGNHIPVIGDIQKPDVSINTYTLTVDPLYLNVVSDLQVTVTNHSVMRNAVFWGYPTDSSTEDVTIETFPRCFILEPEGKQVVQINIVPHSTGPLQNLYVPCFVEANSQPLLLKIQGTVEGVRIRVEWDSKDRHCCIFWPPPTDGFEQENHGKLEKYVCSCPPNSLEASQTFLGVKCDIFTLTSDSCASSAVQAVNTAFDETLDNVTLNKVDFDQIQDKVHNDENIDDEDNISVASSIPYLNWPIVGGRYIRDAMDEEWEAHFNNLFIMDELSREFDTKKVEDSTYEPNTLCFHDIPVQKPVTQTIYIRNDTTIPTSFEASVVHNFERVQKTNKPPDGDTILKKIRGEYDEYVDRASRHRGLTVFVTPDTGDLAANDYVILSVTVVAFSWGDYLDTIVLQVGDLNHMCISLSVSVTQPPVITPPVVSFGTLPLKCPPVSHVFKVQNVSTVPVYVCWDIFTPTSEKLPFGVALFDNDPFDIELTEYYGSNSSMFLEVKDKYTFLEPDSSKMIEVLFHPHFMNICNERKEVDKILKALLIGYVYITEAGRQETISENCIRDERSQLRPLQVDLEALIEVPLLSLLNVFNYQLVFKCTAYDIMKTTDKVWNATSIIKVQNNSKIELEARVDTVGFFYVTQIKYPCGDKRNSQHNHYLTLRPGEYCEVTIMCEVTESDFLECFEPNSEDLDEQSIGVCSVEPGLLWFEQEYVRQEVKLELWLYPPLLQFSETSLQFGSVYIEDTKTMLVNISAPLNEEYFEAAIKGGPDSPFSVDKPSGELKPKIGYLLKVFFSPKLCTIYQDTLVVRSCLVKLAREIPLTGIGSFDYRDHTY